MTKVLPDSAGVSLKPRHYNAILDQIPDVGWFEIHPENYMGEGGSPHNYLARIRQHYPLSMHGVGMSLGSVNGLDRSHLQALADLVKRYQPEQVSEHLAWSQFNDVFLNDLLPLPYNEESLQIVAGNINQLQDCLGRAILIENPSSYIAFKSSTFSEPDFLTELARRTGCGLLLDINNIYVSACNLGYDPMSYLHQIPHRAIGEIHLAGHAVQHIDEVEIRIDDHGSRVGDAVWSLYETLLKYIIQPIPVLIEWDTDVPDLETLVGEARKADQLTKKFYGTGRMPTAS